MDGIRRKLAQHGASSQLFSSAGVAHRVSNLKEVPIVFFMFKIKAREQVVVYYAIQPYSIMQAE